MNDEAHNQIESQAKKRKISDIINDPTDNSAPSEQPQTGEAPITRVNDLWFDDGSVILQAGSSQFRVHRSFLSRSSTVFKDMFALPQPASDMEGRMEDIIEGCPVIHLQDSVDDVTCMLTAIYDHGKYDSMHKILFKEVSALLRLGSKYDIPNIRNNALQRLRAEFPTTLEEWDQLDVEYKTMSDSPDICLFDVITLAYNEGILSILPTLYYLYICESADLSSIFYGMERSDRTKATLPSVLQRDLVLGREELAAKAPLHSFKWLRDDWCSEECSKPKGCRSIRNKLIERRWLAPNNVGYPFDTWSEQITDPDISQMCADCLDEIKHLYEEGRRDLWDLLPTFFNLPEWEELMRMDRG